MKRLILILAIICYLIPSSAQRAIDDYTFDTRHKNIYVEFLGSSFMAGIHFDMRFQKGRRDGLGFKFGIGGGTRPALLWINTVRSIPFELNYVLGNEKASLLLGIGVADIKYTTGDLFLSEVEEHHLSGVTFHTAFRLQPMQNGFFFQMGLNFLPETEDFSFSPFGISIGYGFK